MSLHPRTLPAGFIAPCLPTKATTPSGDVWLHEIKHDDFRVIARKDANRVKLYSRPGNDLTDRFPLIVEALAKLRSQSCIIDGEAVACGDDGIGAGRSSLQKGKSRGSSPLGQGPQSAARSAAADRDGPIATILLRFIGAVEVCIPQRGSPLTGCCGAVVAPIDPATITSTKPPTYIRTSFMGRGNEMVSLIRQSIDVAGHKTIVNLEPVVWKRLREIATERRETLPGLIGTINADRQNANLSSAIRLFVLRYYRDQIDLARMVA